MSETFPLFALECVASDLEVEVMFNGWPVFRHDGVRDRTRTTQLNPMVIEGPNILSVSTRPKPGTNPERRFILQLFRTLTADDNVILLHYRFRPDLQPLAEDGFTEVFRQEIEFARTFGRWEWQDARPYMDVDRPAVITAVRELYESFARGDADAFVNLCSLKLREHERAQGKDPGVLIADQKKWLGFVIGDENRTVEPLDPDNLRLESWCQGRLVDVRAANGDSPLRSDWGGNKVNFDAVFTRVGETWVVAR
ncbi:MAG: hypothetical protein U0271_15770 [Polyangiaceae bacterium]